MISRQLGSISKKLPENGGRVMLQSRCDSLTGLSVYIARDYRSSLVVSILLITSMCHKDGFQLWTFEPPC